MNSSSFESLERELVREAERQMLFTALRERRQKRVSPTLYALLLLLIGVTL
jgi:hypothetical protein